MIHNPKYQLGIFSWFGFVLPLPERLKLIKDAGFDAATLWWEDEIGSPAIKKEHMPKIVRDSGLILENIHIPYDNCDDLWSEYKSSRDAVVNKYIGWLNDCAEYNIPMMVMHISDSLNLPSPNKYGLDSISRLLKVAEDLEVVIAVENTGREDYICFVLSELNSEYLGLCYDSSHNRIYSRDNLTLLEQLGNRLTATHFSDNDGNRDSHWLPGEGIINWEKVIDVFPKTEYSGYLTLEVYPTQKQLKRTARDFLAKAYQSALWIRKLCEN